MSLQACSTGGRVGRVGRVGIIGRQEMPSPEVPATLTVFPGRAGGQPAGYRSRV